MNILENLKRRKEIAIKEKLSLAGPVAIMNLLGNPQNKIPSIHVAGTNGKGSVCSMLASILMQAGNRVAQFSSPHLHHYTERLVIQGEPVEEGKFLEAIQHIISLESELPNKLSYFEIIIAASFYLAYLEKLDWLVVEVGLGGKFDATNVIRQPRATVITSIGLDHTAILGESEYLIAKEKAGIFRKDSPAFVGLVSEEAKSSILEEAQKIGATVYFLEKEPTSDPSIPQYKANNINLVQRVATNLGFSKEIIYLGIAHSRWPGRLEEIQLKTDVGEANILLDGAHNPDGVFGLIDYLNRKMEKKFIFLISILSTKDSTSMLLILRNWSKDKAVQFIFCRMNNENCEDPRDLASKIEGSITAESSEEGLKIFKEKLDQNSLGIITGSLYFLGEIREKLVDKPFRTIAN